MEKVLVISKSFYPDSSVSSFRSSRLVEQLPDLDWEPYVLTLSDGKTGDRYQKSHIEHQTIPFQDVSIKNDAGIRWVPSLIKRAVQVINEEGIDVFLITGPPFMIFSAAPVIKYLTETPYVLDLRDPWSLGLDERDNNVFEVIFKILTISGEPLAFHYADQIIMNSKQMLEEYENTYDGTRYNVTLEKLSVVRNGYSEGDLVRESSPDRSFDPFILTYPGKFRGPMRDVLIAFRDFCQDINPCKFTHFGDEHGQYTEDVRSNIAELDLVEEFSFEGFVNQSVVMSALDEANVGIAVTRKTDLSHIPLKIYDYIARDLPIIVLDDPDGAAAQLVDNFKHGYVASHGESDEITNILFNIYDRGIDSLDDIETRAMYSMTHRVSEMAKILEKVHSGTN